MYQLARKVSRVADRVCILNELAKPWKLETVLSADGSQKLRVATYVAGEVAGVKRWFVFANGRSEYIEKYANLPRELGLAKDVGFLTWDHQGQGASGGPRSHISSYATFADDLRLIIRKYVAGSDYILVGHSMGALVALYAAQKFTLDAKLLALYSPLLRLPPKPIPPGIAKRISDVVTAAGFGRMTTGVGRHKPREAFVRNRYTHSIEGYERIQATPFGCPGASFAWVHATQQAIGYVNQREHIEHLSMPVRLVGGSDENVVDMKGWSAWASKALELGVDVHYSLVSGARHELFSEIPKYRDESIRILREGAPTFFVVKNPKRTSKPTENAKG